MDNDHSQFELSESAFLTLLVKHEPSLRAYARSLVPDWDLVDEALQEASVIMWQKRGQLESLDGFVPWARVILRFKCLRQVEKLRSQRPLLSDDVLGKLADRGESRQEEAAAARARALHECPGEFSAELRELLLAPHCSATSVVELAERREKTPNAHISSSGDSANSWLTASVSNCRRRFHEQFVERTDSSVSAGGRHGRRSTGT